MKVWNVKFAEGNRLADAMNDLEEEGYEPIHILQCGIRPQPHRLDPKKVDMIPLFVIAGKAKMRLISDA